MNDERQQMWGRAWTESRSYLRRWSDPLTRAARDDLAQETAVAAMRQLVRQRDRGAFSAAVRTIARRLRSRVLRAEDRPLQGVAEGDLGEWPAPVLPPAPQLLVAGRLVPQPWLLLRLDRVLTTISRTNRLLLLGFYEGFSCSELAERFGLSADAVKVRLHRCRQRLRRRLESAVRAADRFET
jgi:RNA polymerase sigma factor (sigma-70 family)